MITKEALQKVLKDNGFDEQAITRILNKNLKTLIERGKFDNINAVLKTLNEFHISKEAIENCLLVLNR